MNWKHVLSLSPEDLSEEEKDELYNTLAWFDCEKEKLDIKKCVAVIKLCQEIMKYKAEQVETLLGELDELATKQGEDEVKMGESDASKSKKSMDYEELEEEYVNLKNKLKKQAKLNEKNTKEIVSLKQTIASLERDKIALQNELQSVHHDTNSQSDVSETTKEECKELVDTLRQKNRQISDLLNDIEDVESENALLREKLSNIREELKDGAHHINLMSNELQSYKIKVNEQNETIEKLMKEKELLQSEVQDLLEQKQNNAREVQEFTEEINYKIDELKKILDEKNQEILELKSKTPRTGSDDDSQEISFANEQSHLSALNRIVVEKEQQIVELRTQLENATKEMEETTALINNVTDERKSDKKKLQELSSQIQNLKGQLKSAHERGKNLQATVTSLEEISEMKSKELNDLFAKLKENGQIELGDCLRQIQDLKIQNKVQEKQIADYVKTCNKLQQNLDSVDEENGILRNKLGIAEDESVISTTFNLRKRKEKKELQQLRVKLENAEKESLDVKVQLQKANKIIGKLSNQVHELGGKIDLNGDLRAVEKTAKDTKLKKEMLVIIQENEALRKGLHEILESVNTKKGNTVREIKSETLEKLLIALDVKHISGWYHPAMRMQAELHACEARNNELREQLRLTRIELNQYRESRPQLPFDYESFKNVGVPSKLSEDLHNILLKYEQEKQLNSTLKNKLEEFKTQYELVEQQIIYLYNEYANEKEQQTKLAKEITQKTKLLDEKLANADTKLNEFITFANLGDDELAKAKHVADLTEKLHILNRKCLYMENEQSKLHNEIGRYKNELLDAERATIKKIVQLRTEKKVLALDKEILENKLAISIDGYLYENLQKTFDETIIKYKTLLGDFNKISGDHKNELDLLKETTRLLQDEKRELANKLVDVLTKSNTISDNFEIGELTKKLAQSEVNEITERQRANHTNNLYELVKEQLNKSEERFRDFEKYNKEILHKNLVLQENLKDLQDKINNSIDVEVFKKFQSEHDEILNKNKQLVSDLGSLKEHLKVSERTIQTQKLWKYSCDFELLSLKHQIVDLQAESDDKTVIARLSSDVVRARLAEADCQKKIECLMEELESLQKQHEEFKESVENDKKKSERCVLQLNKKISNLQELISRQRLQYFGCIPLTSEEKFVEKLKQVFIDKHEAFVALQNAHRIESEQLILKEALKLKTNSLDELLSILKNNDKNTIMKWNEEKKTIQLKELKCRRELDFKNKQLEQMILRQQAQDKQMEKLEEELLTCTTKFNHPVVFEQNFDDAYANVSEKSPDLHETVVKVYKSQETQTIDTKTDVQHADEKFNSLQNELLKTYGDISTKDAETEQLKIRINELEMNVSLFRKQIGDKQSQITFYEKHILELQNKKEQNAIDVKDTTDSVRLNQEIVTLQATISALQSTIGERDEAILKYQSLLKEDRDEHSKAADRMQKEVKRLQVALAEQTKSYKDLESVLLKNETQPHPSKAAIEHYFQQVHALEEDAAESRTKVTSLTSQLQASRQECVRWRALANDRLVKMEELQKELESQHLNELMMYKNDCQKLQGEITALKEMVFNYKSELDRVGPNFNRILKEKEDKIHHLTILLKQSKNPQKPPKREVPQPSPADSEKEDLAKEHEVLKKRFDQLLQREKNAREEIRNLKNRLARKPPSSARSDKSERSIKEQLQKKVVSLENEIAELKESLEKQSALNEMHKIKTAEDFDRWKKQKQWQQTVEKLKNKLKDKSAAYEKLQQSCTSFRLLIERLEREKHVLENRMRNLKDVNPSAQSSRVSELQDENWRLKVEIEGLLSKLELQQHHSGALGAAMLQDKLEAQERKIAILELSAKGSTEVRAEMERLQCAISNMQKNNLRLEAENLELRLDLEKFNSEVPHLKEQIQHLESYVEVLKKERTDSKTTDETPEPNTTELKKNFELERTVFLLKRVIEKLQAENKRLLGGSKPCTLTDRSGASDKLKRELHKIKEQYEESVKKISTLEKELKASNDTIKSLQNKSESNEELHEVKLELAQKSQLLEKVKVLLQRAAARERVLLEEISHLKRLTPVTEKSTESSSD